MLIVTCGDKSKVKNITFEKPLDYLHSKGDHAAIAKATKGYKACSVLIGIQPLNEELFDDPKHCKHINYITPSLLKREAQQRLTNRYYDLDKVEDKLKEYELKMRKGNYTTEEENHKFKNRLVDAVFEMQEMKLYPEIIRYLTDHTKYKLDSDGFPLENDEGEGILADPDIAKEQYKKELERICMPTVNTSYERIIHMPKPFNFWDYRNPFQQYYFIDKGDKIHHIHGGSGSSGAREMQGLYAHVFATLEDEYGYKIPTYTFKYTDKNEMQFLTQYNCFKAMNRELSGNYQNTSTEVKLKLFKGRVLEFDDTRSFKDSKIRY